MPGLRGASREGFTLAEFLLTLILFAAAFLPLLSAINSSLLAATETESSTIALSLAQAKIETALNTPFNSLVTAAASPVPNFPKFRAALQVTTPLTDLKQVQATIYWDTSPSTTPQAKRAAGSVQVLTLETYVLN